MTGPARRDRPMGVKRRMEQRDVPAAILEATAELLKERSFEQLSVAEILGAARVSRASFYFYFASKHAVLAEIVRGVVEAARATAQPWIEQDVGETRLALQRGTGDGVRLWMAHAPVLRAIVESWRSDAGLQELWSTMMQGFTSAATYRIERDRRAGRAPDNGLDPQTLASVLTWMNERVFYLAAVGHPAFADEQRMVDVIANIWWLAIYGQVATPAD